MLRPPRVDPAESSTSTCDSRTNDCTDSSGANEKPSTPPEDVHGDAAPPRVETARKVALPARDRVTYSNLFGARTAPLGLVDRLILGYRRQLIVKPGALYADSQAGVALDTSITPAYASIGPRIEIQPLTVLRIAANYQFIQYFRSFGALQSFPDAHADHSYAEQSRRADLDLHYAARGHQIDISVLLQGKVGPVIVRNEGVLRWANLGLRDGDTVYLDKLLDTLVPNRGFTYINDLDTLVVLRKRLYLGARYSVVAPIYGAAELGGEDIESPNGPIHRLGPAILFEIYNRPGARFNKPSLFLVAQWHLAHRYRTGQEFNAAVPLLMAGMFFSGDLWRRP